MARKTQTLEIAQTAGLERLIVGLVSKLAVLAPPWAVLLILLGVSAISHSMWGKPPAVTWATMAATLSTMLLTGLTWLVAHARGPIGRTHSTLSTFGAGLWFTIATITGVGTPLTGGMLFFGGSTLALGWNIRSVIRSNTEPGEGRHGDALGSLFDNAKASFGLGGAKVRTKEVTDHKIKAKLELPPGEKVTDDVVKKTEYIEAGMHFPPGSVLVAHDKDDASKAHFTVTDPRIMDRPIPWPGPSRPGASIAEPVRIGVFQDAEYVEPILPGSHLQIMGASGSGKSLGGTWNVLGEAITRNDVAVFGIDVAKDEQTFKPLRASMHGIHVTQPRAVAFIRALNTEIPKRTKYLSDHGYTEWEPGCGLLFWVVVFEEIAKLFDKIGTKDTELVEQIAKEIRSAGGHVIMSLQRSTYTEISTVVRSQLAFCCFGLNSSDDNQYGLSEAQQRADADPSMWGTGRPEHVGKAFIDCKGIPSTHVAMPMRTYAYGKTPREAAAALTAHAAQWPASARHMDEFTARLAALDPAAPKPGHAIAMPAASTDQPASDEGQEVDAEAVADLLANAAELVITAQLASTAMLQRKLRLPYEQCLRLMEALERKGVVGPQPKEGARPVLVSTDDMADVVEQLREDGDPAAEYLRTEDPSPDLVAGAEDEVTEPTLKEDRFYVGSAEQDAQRKTRKLPPGQARALVHDWIRKRATTDPTFTAGDRELTAVRTEAGMTSRGWIYKVLADLVDVGVLDEDKEGATTTYTVADVEALDDLGEAA